MTRELSCITQAFYEILLIIKIAYPSCLFSNQSGLLPCMTLMISNKQYNFKILIGLAVKGKQVCLVKLHSRYLQAPAEGQSKMCSQCVGLSKTANLSGS